MSSTGGSSSGAAAVRATAAVSTLSSATGFRGAVPSALPPSFREGRNAEELRALQRQVRALGDQIGQAARATEDEDAGEAARVAAEAARVQEQAAAAEAARLHAPPGATKSSCCLR